MSKVIASYLVRITLRGPELTDAPPPGGDMYPPEPPTNDAVIAVVEAAFEAGHPDIAATVTSERTDI